MCVKSLTTSLPTDLMKRRRESAPWEGGRDHRNPWPTSSECAPPRSRAVVRFDTKAHIGRWVCSASVRRQSMERFTDPKRRLFLRHHPDAVPAVNWWVFYEMAAALDIDAR
jgi:hypothetical protein